MVKINKKSQALLLGISIIVVILIGVLAITYIVKNESQDKPVTTIRVPAPTYTQQPTTPTPAEPTVITIPEVEEEPEIIYDDEEVIDEEE